VAFGKKKKKTKTVETIICNTWDCQTYNFGNKRMASGEWSMPLIIGNLVVDNERKLIN